MYDHQTRSKIHPKQNVIIIIKNNGVYDGTTVEGRVRQVLTPPEKDYQPKGIKVELEDGTVGRVKEIVKKKRA